MFAQSKYHFSFMQQIGSIFYFDKNHKMQIFIFHQKPFVYIRTCQGINYQYAEKSQIIFSIVVKIHLFHFYAVRKHMCQNLS